MTVIATTKNPLLKNYVIIPNVGFLANIGRCASTSLSLAVVSAYYPQGAADITPGVYVQGTPNPPGQFYYPDGQTSQTTPAAKAWLIKNGCMSTKPDGTVFAIVRDPVERFLSACALFGVTSDVDVAAALIQLQAGKLDNIYEFAKQTPYLNSGQPTQLYNFDTDLGQLASDLGLGALPNISLNLAGANITYPVSGKGKLKNGGTTSTPTPPQTGTLTADQTTALQTYYANDVTLLNNLTTPGQVYTPPVQTTPPTPTPISLVNPANPAPAVTSMPKISPTPT